MSKSTLYGKLAVRFSGILHTRKDWLVSSSDDLNPVFSFSTRPIIQSPDGSWELPLTEHDIFDIRDRLFRVDDAEAALDFLAKFGPVRTDKMLGSIGRDVKLSEIIALRDLRREFLVNKTTAGDFRRSGMKGEPMSTVASAFDLSANIAPPLVMFRQGKEVVAQVRCADVYDATHAAVYLDRLDGFSWSECDKCGAPYKPTSRHPRLYCSLACTNAARAALRYERDSGTTPQWLNDAREKRSAATKKRA